MTYDKYVVTAESVDKTEAWCEVGQVVKGLLVNIEDKFYVMIEVGESGDYWLESIEVDGSTVKELM